MDRRSMTVGELRKKLEGIPDDLEVRLSSDTGVDCGIGEILIEDAYRTQHNLPNGKIDEFCIYATDLGNEYQEEE